MKKFVLISLILAFVSISSFAFPIYTLTDIPMLDVDWNTTYDDCVKKFGTLKCLDDEDAPKETFKIDIPVGDSKQAFILSFLGGKLYRVETYFASDDISDITYFYLTAINNFSRIYGTLYILNGSDKSTVTWKISEDCLIDIYKTEVTDCYITAISYINPYIYAYKKYMENRELQSYFYSSSVKSSK